MRRTVNFLFTLLLLTGTALAQAAQDIWQEVIPAQRQAIAAQTNASSSRYFDADIQALQRILELSPAEHIGDRSNIVHIPMPDGSFARFAIVESPIMEPELAARYPQLKNYKAYGIDDPGATGRLSFNPNGFGGMLHTSQGRVFIDLDNSSGRNNRYVMRNKRDAGSGNAFRCDAYDLDANIGSDLDLITGLGLAPRSASRAPGNYLTYLLAVATTNEYWSIFGSDLATTTAINVDINRVNEIYERDFGIRLILIGNNDALYESVDNGLLNNSSALVLIDQTPGWINGRIAVGDYDIGHMFSQGGGGLAWLGAVCDDTNKARGVSGIFSPVGDPFYIDFVAHEIGHQFNADHTFNGTTGSCNGQRWAPTAFEPGSGSTIMGYSGICDEENLQNFSDATFHSGSIAQVNTFVGAAACGVLLPNGNVDPTIVTPGLDYTIPINTPFILDNTSAMDTDALSYQWDQMDVGASTNNVSFGTDLGNNPLFRSYEPRPAESFRNFPALGTQVNAQFDDAEVLPCKSRTLNFRLTVRDDNSGQATDDVRVTTDVNSGPFRVTSHDTPQTVITSNPGMLVTWNVAGTNNAPVSCANVDIKLMTFNNAGYAQYSIHTLLSNTPNDGSETVIFQNPERTMSHSRARLRVECSTNIFYAISDADLVIVGTDAGPLLFSDTDNTTFFNNGGTVGSVAPDCPIDNSDPPPSGGSSAFSWQWLLLLSGLIAAVKLLRRQEG